MTVKWHPYPKEKPTEEKEYRVRTESGDVVVSYFWNDAMAWDFERVDVIAWAEP